MAALGLPAMHEDDSDGAARALVSIRPRVRPHIEAGSPPEARIDISAGEVVANPRATGKGEFMITGEAVNLAARLQQNAEPRQILVGECTMLDGRGGATGNQRPPLVGGRVFANHYALDMCTLILLSRGWYLA